MRKLKFVAHFALAIATALACTSGARADRLFFSEVGFPVLSDPLDPESRTVAPSPLAPLTVPSITMNVGEPKTLHIWMQMVAPNHSYDSVAWSIDAGTGGVVRATDHTVANPLNFNRELPRWDAAILGTLGTGNSTDLLEDAYGFRVGREGVGFSSLNGHNLRTDQGRDNNTYSYYLGTVTLQAAASGTTGLYFRTGDFKHVSVPGPASVQYGASAASYLGNVVDGGDPITADNLEADAIIQVMGIDPVGPTLALLPNPTASAAGDIVFNASPAGTFVNGGGRTSGRITFVDYIGQNDGALPLFFDLVPGANAAQLVTDLNAIVGRPFTASASTFGGADVVLNFANQPAGSDLFVDFDFGTGNGVARVGIPEPSTLALASMSLFGLVGVAIRRRRAAKA